MTGQSLVSHAGLNVLTSFLDATRFGSLCEDCFSQFVPAQAIHRPGRILGSLALMLAGGGNTSRIWMCCATAPDSSAPVPSNATVSRFVERAADQPEAFAHGFTTLRPAAAFQDLGGGRDTESRRAGHPAGPAHPRH